MALGKLARGLALCALVVVAATQDVVQPVDSSILSSAAAPSQAVGAQQSFGGAQQGAFAMAPSFATMGGAPSASQAGAPAGAMMGAGGASFDQDALNFALQLSYLEAAFYQQAAFGKQVPAELRGGGPEATGGRKGTFTPQVEAFAQELAMVSLDHIKTLRDLLGDAAAPMPAINLDSWQQVANQALNKDLQPVFDPYANDLFFSHAVYFLQGLDVTSLRGLISLTSNSKYISVLAGILGAEAYFDGAIRWRLSDRLAVMTPWQQPVWRVLNAFTTLRTRLSGQQLVPYGIVQPVAQSTLKNAPNPRTFAGGNAIQIAMLNPDDGLVFSRSPGETLAALYLTGDASKPGGFFPQGVNGNLKKR